eukprot:gene26940-35640_t
MLWLLNISSKDDELQYDSKWANNVTNKADIPEIQYSINKSFSHHHVNKINRTMHHAGNISRSNETVSKVYQPFATMYAEEKVHCPNFSCVDQISSANLSKFEVFNVLGTTLVSEYAENMANISHTFRKPTFAALFDWVLTNACVKVCRDKKRCKKTFSFDKRWKCTNSIDVLYGNIAIPRTIFVATVSLDSFVRSVLPRLTHPFILYSGMNEYTIPHNLDLRFNSNRIKRKFLPLWKEITEHNLLLRWYVENHDLVHPKVSTMPIGLKPTDFIRNNQKDFLRKIENITKPLYSRPLKVLSVDRVRDGPQWADRKNAHHLCAEMQGDLCQVANSSLSHREFIVTISQYPFLLCVHGGGIDPSPKAWEAMLVGTIPVLEHSALDDAYSHFPVAFVDNITDFLRWNTSEIKSTLTQWLRQLGKYYERGSQLRNDTLHKLSTGYWFHKISYSNDQPRSIPAFTPIYTDEKVMCPNFNCVDRSPSSSFSTNLSQFEVYNTMATRIATKNLDTVANLSETFKVPSFAALFDWVVINVCVKVCKEPMGCKRKDLIKKCTHSGIDVLYGNVAVPRTIFVVTISLDSFAKYILPRLNHPFVLYTGTNDLTIPNNLDLRYDSRKVRRKFLPLWKEITEHNLLLRWYVENHDLVHPKVSTMPIGLNPREFDPHDRQVFLQEIENITKPLYSRPLKVLSVDRVRDGPQWADRKNAHHLCAEMQGDLCQVANSSLSHREFIVTISQYPFLLCVHGGGIDPSPKAWEAMLVGTIPVLEHSALDDAYSQLPVAFVDNIADFLRWNTSAIKSTLTQWLLQLGKYYEVGSELRNDTLHKLSTAYWFNKIVGHF